MNSIFGTTNLKSVQGVWGKGIWFQLICPLLRLLFHKVFGAEMVHTYTHEISSSILLTSSSFSIWWVWSRDCWSTLTWLWSEDWGQLGARPSQPPFLSAPHTSTAPQLMLLRSSSLSRTHSIGPFSKRSNSTGPLFGTPILLLETVEQ